MPPQRFEMRSPDVSIFFWSRSKTLEFWQNKLLNCWPACQKLFNIPSSILLREWILCVVCVAPKISATLILPGSELFGQHITADSQNCTRILEADFLNPIQCWRAYVKATLCWSALQKHEKFNYVAMKAPRKFDYLFNVITFFYTAHHRRLKNWGMRIPNGICGKRCSGMGQIARRRRRKMGFSD